MKKINLTNNVASRNTLLSILSKERETKRGKKDELIIELDLEVEIEFLIWKCELNSINCKLPGGSFHYFLGRKIEIFDFKAYEFNKRRAFECRKKIKKEFLPIIVIFSNNFMKTGNLKKNSFFAQPCKIVMLSYWITFRITLTICQNCHKMAEKISQLLLFFCPKFPFFKEISILENIKTQFLEGSKLLLSFK